MASEVHTPGLFALYTVFFILTLVATGLRLLSRRIARLGLWWDDYLILVAAIVHTVGYGLLINALVNGGGKHVKDVPPEDVEPYLQMTFASEFIYVFTVGPAQISLLCFCLRLFKIRKAFARTVYIFIALVVSWCIAFFFSTVFQCDPVPLAFAEIPNESHCLNYRSWLLGTNIPHIMIDFSILCLPIHEVWQLSLSRLQKVGLTSIFLLGTLTSAISIIRTYFNASIVLTDPTWDYTPVQLWSALEGSVSDVCVCLPSMAPLVRFACGGRRFGKHRGSPVQVLSNESKSKKSKRCNNDSTFSKLNEDQAELLKTSHIVAITPEAIRSQHHPIPLQNIRITSEFDVRNELRV